MQHKTARFHQTVQKLVDAQKQANAKGVPLKQHLDEESAKQVAANNANSSTSSTSGAGATLPKAMQKYKASSGMSSSTTTSSASSLQEAKLNAAFANPNKILSEPKTTTVSAGPQSSGLVNGHIAKLSSQVQASGGKVATLHTSDLSSAFSHPKGMMNLEDKLRGSSLVHVQNVQNLSPREGALLGEIHNKMSSKVPMMITTPSVGNLSNNPYINTSLIEKIAPAAKTLDVRLPGEIPGKSIYDSFKSVKSGSSFLEQLLKNLTTKSA